MKGIEYPQYKEIKEKLAQGWNTWNTRSITSYAHLPSGYTINLAWKQHYWLDEKYLKETLIGKNGDDDPIIKPGEHPFDASYTKIEMAWKELRCQIETAKIDDDLVILINPTANIFPPVKLIVESGMLWNRAGSLSKSSDNRLAAITPKKDFEVYTTKDSCCFPTAECFTPFLAIEFDEVVGISTGKARSIDEISEIIQTRKIEYQARADKYDNLAEAYKAIQAGIAWNTIYDPKNERVISTVGRLWNEEYGGYCLFGWDNFFLSYMISLDNKELAFANIIEHLDGVSDEGFICNDNRGNGCKSWDRSQPPVGSIMVQKIYQRYPERWFLEATFDALYGWNRWWLKKRMNNGLLSYGSHVTTNLYHEPHTNSMITAKYESGMDDSPMYIDVPFNQTKNTMELQDVGLNSLFIADCKALVEMGGIIGKESEIMELEKTITEFTAYMENLWEDDFGFYLNKRTDTNELSKRISPTMFYPLLAGIVSDERAKRFISEHFDNPEEFAGDYILPSIARNDETFHKQAYWKGAIWPPLNFLSYLSLQKYNFAEAQKELAQKSLDLFLKEWKRKGYVSENYSSITGTGDDERLYSDSFHSWGALFGIMSFIEAGYLE